MIAIVSPRKTARPIGMAAPLATDPGRHAQAIMGPNDPTSRKRGRTLRPSSCYIKVADPVHDVKNDMPEREVDPCPPLECWIIFPDFGAVR